MSDDFDELRVCGWGAGGSTGLLLADEAGAVVRADTGRHDPADGFVTAAILGQLERTEVRRAAVLSDGAAALVDYGLVDWTKLLNILEHEGPTTLIQRVREAETSDAEGIRWPRFKSSDDATAIVCTF